VSSREALFPGAQAGLSEPLGWRWLGGLLRILLLALLVAEVASLRASLDTDRFLGDERLWARVLLETRHGAAFLITTLAAWLLLSGAALRAEYAACERAHWSLRPAVAFGLLHLVLLLAFRQASGWLLREFDGGTTAGLALLIGWVGLALSLPFTLACVAFAPPAAARALARLLPGLGAAALVAGLSVVASVQALSSGLWRPLLAGTAILTTRLLELVPGPGPTIAALESEGFRLALGDFDVLVTRLCSGFEGLALTGVFLAAYFAAFRRSLRFPHVLLLVPLALAAIYLLNAVRLAALVWIGDRLSPELAMSGFHSHAGWIAFCSLALGLVFLSRRVAWFHTVQGAEARASLTRHESVNPAALYLAPLLALLVTSFVTGAMTSGFDLYYPLRLLAGVACLAWAWSELPPRLLAVTRVGLGYGVGAFVLWFALERAGVQPRASGLPSGWEGLGPVAAGAWVVLRVLGFVLLVPLAEELAFRGFLLRRLSSSAFETLDLRRVTPFAWVGSSLAFGLMHGQWIAGVGVGALYALAAMQRGRLGDAVIAHAVTNALLVLAAPLHGPWYAWL